MYRLCFTFHNHTYPNKYSMITLTVRGLRGPGYWNNGAMFVSEDDDSGSGCLGKASVALPKVHLIITLGPGDYDSVQCSFPPNTCSSCHRERYGVLGMAHTYTRTHTFPRPICDFPWHLVAFSSLLCLCHVGKCLLTVCVCVCTCQ